MEKYIEAIEQLRNEMLEEKESIENDYTIYRQHEKIDTLESIFSKLCELQVGLTIGVTEMDLLEDDEIEILVNELLNKDTAEIKF